MTTKMPATIALVVLLTVITVLIIVMTPWHPLGTVPAGAAVAPDISRDFSAAEQARSGAYNGSAIPVGLLSLLVSTVFTILLGLTPLGARLVARFPGPAVVQVLLGGLALLLILRLATLPFAVRAEVLRRTYGLSTRSWSGFAVDVAKGFAINAGTTLLLVALVALLARTWPGWWWAIGAGAAAILVFVISFIYPLVVEPVFNSFTPLSAGPLRTSLLELADKDGVPVKDILVADASKRTSTLNAYVSGYGSSRRIVIYDTLLTGASPAEVRLIVAHELGHVKANDVLHGTILGALAAAAAVIGLYLALTWSPLLTRAGASNAGDPRVVALVIALITLATLLSLPVQNLLSRQIEERADIHALNLTRDPAGFVRMQKRLAVTGLSDLHPNPWLSAWFSTHPSTGQRIADARTWAVIHRLPVPGDLVEAAP